VAILTTRCSCVTVLAIAQNFHVAQNLKSAFCLNEMAHLALFFVLAFEINA
jgi:hypothetical protein